MKKSIEDPKVEKISHHEYFPSISLQKKKIATVVDVIAGEIISHGFNKKKNFGGDEVPESEEELLSEKKNLEVQHAVHILKIYRGKEHFWKKVFGKKNGDVFYYNCLTEEKQFQEPLEYVEIMEEPIRDRSREKMQQENENLVFNDKDYKRLVEHIMILVDIDDNGIIELEELEHFPGAQDILQKYFEQLNVSYLTKRDICDLFPTKKELSEIIKKLENVFVYGERDEFLLGVKVQPILTHEDENLAREIRRMLDDLRVKVEVTNEDNFTACLESMSQEGNIYLCSGVIVEIHSKYAILTAGHCITNREGGKVKKNDCVRIFIPTLPEYNIDTNMFARFKKIDPRFNTIIVNSSDLFVYPYYMDDGHTGAGTDIGIIKFTKKKEVELKTLDFTSIPFQQFATYKDILPNLKIQYPVFEKNITISDLQGLWVNSDDNNIVVENNTVNFPKYEYTAIIKETDNQFILNDYVLKKSSNTLIWKSNTYEVYWHRPQDHCSIDKFSDLEVRGFPGQSAKCYELYNSRKMYNEEQEEEINLFDSTVIKENDHFIILYTNQTTAGQSGGPLLLLLKDENPLLLGIHVSGHAEVARATGFSPNIINWFNFIYGVYNELDLTIKSEKLGSSIIMKYFNMSFTQSRVLRLVQKNIGYEACVVLSKVLPNFTNLIKLLLEKNQIDDECCVALSKVFPNLTNLEQLLLSENSIGDEGCVALSETLSNLTNLTSLQLWNNKIGDEGCVALGEILLNLTNLTELDLSSNKISFEEKNKFRSLHGKEIETFFI